MSSHVLEKLSSKFKVKVETCYGTSFKNVGIVEDTITPITREEEDSLDGDVTCTTKLNIICSIFDSIH